MLSLLLGGSLHSTNDREICRNAETDNRLFQTATTRFVAAHRTMDGTAPCFIATQITLSQSETRSQKQRMTPSGRRTRRASPVWPKRRYALWVQPTARPSNT